MLAIPSFSNTELQIYNKNNQTIQIDSQTTRITFSYKAKLSTRPIIDSANTYHTSIAIKNQEEIQIRLRRFGFN